MNNLVEASTPGATSHAHDTGARPAPLPSQRTAGGVRGRVMPLARAARLQARYRRAQLRAALPGARRASFAHPPVFLIGCGRSGTTMLGELMDLHPETRYLFEPYHLWTAADPRTDMIHLFHRGDASCALGAADATARVKARFNAVFGRHAPPGGVFVEKTPINTLRIEYLEALAPGARYIHIVRDGVDVVRSIARLAATNSYKIAGRPRFNQWWGDDDIKWRLLARDAAFLGHTPCDPREMDTDEARGALEWIASLREVDRLRDRLGPRLLEVRYPDLLADPRAALTRIGQRAGIEPTPQWLDACAARVDSGRRRIGGQVTLPEGMVDSFNHLQMAHGFAGRAVAEGETTAARIA